MAAKFALERYLGYISEKESSTLQEESRNQAFREYEKIVEKFLEDEVVSVYKEIRDFHKELDALYETNDFSAQMVEIIKSQLQDSASDMEDMLREERLDGMKKCLQEYLSYFSFISRVRELERLYEEKQEKRKLGQKYAQFFKEHQDIRDIAQKLQDTHEITLTEEMEKVVEDGFAGETFFHIRERNQGKQTSKVIALAPKGREAYAYYLCLEEKKYNEEQLNECIFARCCRLLDIVDGKKNIHDFPFESFGTFKKDILLFKLEKVKRRIGLGYFSNKEKITTYVEDLERISVKPSARSKAIPNSQSFLESSDWS